MGALDAQGLRRGVLCGVSAYLLWGIFPVYFKAVAEVPAPEVLAHRVVWCLALLAPLAWWRGSGARVWAAVRSRRTLGVLLGSTLLLGTNWLTFIRAVTDGRVLECSLGYFINPLFSVLLGFLLLGERLRPLQRASIGLAVVGVAVQTWLLGRLPMVALVLAVTFGLYGLMRKRSGVDALTSLTVEMALLFPAALGFLVYLGAAGRASFLAGSSALDALLPLAGVVTATPLLLFGVAVARLRLATMGLLQYLVPSMHFALAVFAFGETLTGAHLVSFGCIWAGLALYSWDSLGPVAREAPPAVTELPPRPAGSGG